MGFYGAKKVFELARAMLKRGKEAAAHTKTALASKMDAVEDAADGVKKDQVRKRICTNYRVLLSWLSKENCWEQEEIIDQTGHRANDRSFMCVFVRMWKRSGNQPCEDLLKLNASDIPVILRSRTETLARGVFSQPGLLGTRFRRAF